MILCEKEDLVLAGLIIDQYNLNKKLGDELSSEELEQLTNADEVVLDKIDELYGSLEEEPDLIEVPVELFHRMAAEVEHHKAMLASTGAKGVIVTFGGSTSGQMHYGVSKDLEFGFRINIRAPEGEELTDEKIDEIINCAIPAWRATLAREGDNLKQEMQVVRQRSTN